MKFIMNPETVFLESLQDGHFCLFFRGDISDNLCKSVAEKLCFI